MKRNTWRHIGREEGPPRILAPRTFEWPSGDISGTGEMASQDAAIDRIIERSIADGTMPAELMPGAIVGPRRTPTRRSARRYMPL